MSALQLCKDRKVRQTQDTKLYRKVRPIMIEDLNLGKSGCGGGNMKIRQDAIASREVARQHMGQKD
ncbi:MAG TPA: hypothetical protein DGH68_03980 [Bacteroidetes bacterium]|nr:hypothetical protein [Bacteroidota bacterium]